MEEESNHIKTPINNYISYKGEILDLIISYSLLLQFCNPFQKRTEKGSMDAVKLREMLYKIQDLTKALEKLNVQAEDKV